MTTSLIVSGLGLLVIIAILAGLSLTEREAQRQAWRRIAAERRRNHEQRQWLRDNAHQLRKHADDPPLEDAWNGDD